MALLLNVITFESTTVHEWELRVVNTKGEPLSGIQVYQTWRYYGLEGSATFNRDVKVTDEKGHVRFPGRTVKASLFRRLLALVGPRVNVNPHASFGPRAHISIFRGSTTSAADYEEGKELPSELTIEE